MAALDTLAAYYVQQARKEKEKEMRKDFFSQVRAGPIKLNSIIWPGTTRSRSIKKEVLIACRAFLTAVHYVTSVNFYIMERLIELHGQPHLVMM
jgi:hypothetical protein